MLVGDRVVAIEELNAGTAVDCSDARCSSTETCAVSHVHVGHSFELIHVSLTQETITCTPKHPFWVHGRGWVEACELTIEDRLMNLSGERVAILGIEREVLTRPIRVYNITVNGKRIFYIGESRILVHNKAL